MFLRARTVLPVGEPPIDDGAVVVHGERIIAVGRFADLFPAAGECSAAGKQVIDLGDSILLPGLINAHCHLDYTNMAGKLSPARNFSDWIKAIVALKAEWSYTEFADSWLKGAQMLLRSGTTTVVDIETVPELLPEVTTSTPLRVISCLELLSVRNRLNARQMVEWAVKKLESLPAASAGLSPHAPYTTSPELLSAAAVAAREHNWLLTTHVAESADEFEMYLNARGAMFDWLKSQRDMSDCGGVSPIAHLARHGVLSPNFLAVHVNYLVAGDIELLTHSGASAVHCPGSHAFFHHRAFPFEELDHAGVNICLGTDSLATIGQSPDEPLALNLFSEMRRLANTFPALTPQRIIEMVTVNPARALGRTEELGRIAPGACADLIALPCGSSNDPYETILSHRGDVLASMVHGRWAIPPNT
jgi:cytosine/adenosine deaminase-related metal-dependent hydrolase